jgi:hypothetical protein
LLVVQILPHPAILSLSGRTPYYGRYWRPMPMASASDASST